MRKLKSDIENAIKEYKRKNNFEYFIPSNKYSEYNWIKYIKFDD